MALDQNYGQAEGLADRLEDFADRLNRDRSIPWHGLGIYYDIRAAVNVIRGEPVAKPLQKNSQEYDL